MLAHVMLKPAIASLLRRPAVREAGEVLLAAASAGIAAYAAREAAGRIIRKKQ